MPDVSARIGGLNATPGAGYPKIHAVGVRNRCDCMRAEVLIVGHASLSPPRRTRGGLLSAVGFAALLAPNAMLAQEPPTDLPEVRVIANTPLAPASPRPARRATPAPSRPAVRPAPPRPRGRRPRARAVAKAPRAAARAAADPGLVDRDKIPANVQTLSAGD